MNSKREQLCPLWLSILIGCAIVTVLAAAYPRADVQKRTLSTQHASTISVAYLEAWLLVEPDSPLYLESLALQYLELGRWHAALAVSKHLANVAGDETSRQKAFLLELVASEQMAYALPAEAPERAQEMQHLAGILHNATGHGWSVTAMRSLAEKARLAGVDDVMVSFYRKLAATDTENAAHWQARLGEVALTTAAYDTAALSYFSAYESATRIDEKRTYFIKALQVLESANKVDQACVEAERHLGGVLAGDSQTLRYLLKLARQANRTDLVARYARALLNAPNDIENGRPKGDTHILLVAAEAKSGGGDTVAKAARLDDEYQLIYQAFIESGALSDAEQVAQMALDQGLDKSVWSARLAQAAQWNNHPDVALQYWLVHARATDDKDSWGKVLELAPGLDNDDAYLIAWSHLQTMRTGVAAAPSDAMNALLAEYMRARRWEPMLRVVERLKELDGDQMPQRALLLEITALEQHAYDFKPGTADRAQFMQRMHHAMTQMQRYDVDPTVMAWMAQKAQETGANEIMVHYYRRLASLGGEQAVQWQAKLGDYALSHQAYEDAAAAYFSAQDAANSRDEKIRYFRAGLGAIVASGHVAQACEAGEQRVGDLLDDPATLRYLIDLARQAHRTDLMARYARELIKVTQQSQRHEPYPEMARSDLFGMQGKVAFWHPQDRLPIRYADLRPTDRIRQLTIADASAGDTAIQQSSERAADLEVAFRAFVESRQLNDAQRAAQQALNEGLDPQVWTPRLAQVAEWNGDPNTALRYWTQYAQASGDAQAWTSVLRLSEQLNDKAAQLAAAKYLSSRSPHDLHLLDKVVLGYEDLGQPESGMAYLKGRAHGTMRAVILERYANLAARSGHDGAAVNAYKELLTFGPNPYEYARGLASINYARGDLSGALATLRSVKDRAGDEPETAGYWRLYSEVAVLLQHSEDADFANRRLLATGRANDADLNTLTYLYSEYPLDGGRIAETQFDQDGSPVALQSALRMYTSARAWPRIEQLLARLTPAQQDYFNRSGQLLAARAGYFAETQRWEAALADFRAALQMPDVTDDIRIAYLWTLVDFGTDDELRVAVHRWRQAAKVNPEYWGVFAAAEMRMGRPVEAVQYLRNQRLRQGDDPLWLMALADAEELTGHEGRAWGLRKLAWKRLQEKAEAVLPTKPVQDGQTSTVPNLFGPLASTPRSDDAARISLSQRMANGDYAKALLVKLLSQEGRSPESHELARSVLADNAGLPTLQDPTPDRVSGSSDQAGVPDAMQQTKLSRTAKEVVLAWALTAEENDLARAWLARQYADHLLRPIDAEIALALAAQDEAELGRLLEGRRKNVSTEMRIEALKLVGRHEEAQTLAFAALDGAPESDERHDLLVDTLMRDRPAVGADVIYADIDPLEYIKTSVTGTLQLTSRWGIGLEAIDRNQKTADEDVLAWVPGHDRELNLMLSHTTPDQRFTLTAGGRKALENFFTVSLRADFNRQGDFKPSFLLGLNQYTDLSQALQVGGMKDTAQLLVQWDPGSRWFFWGSAEASRLRDQNRNAIGDGYEFTADVGYRFSLSRPDWSVRLTGSRGIYSASDNQIDSMRRILPAGDSLAAADLISENFTQYGVMIGFGVNDPNTYWRRWRPFLDAGYVHDSNEGWGPVVNLGVGGSVFGSDHLRLYYLHTAARQGDGRSSTQIGLSYRLFF